MQDIVLIPFLGETSEYVPRIGRCSGKMSVGFYGSRAGPFWPVNLLRTYLNIKLQKSVEINAYIVRKK